MVRITQISPLATETHPCGGRAQQQFNGVLQYQTLLEWGRRRRNIKYDLTSDVKSLLQSLKKKKESPEQNINPWWFFFLCSFFYVCCGVFFKSLGNRASQKTSATLDIHTSTVSKTAFHLSPPTDATKALGDAPMGSQTRGFLLYPMLSPCSTA